MVSFQTIEFCIPDFWLSALVNADFTGLEDEDENILDQWCADYLEGYYHSPIDTKPNGFAKPDVDGVGYCETDIATFQKV